MSILVTSDIHLTDDPNHEYRWKIFPYIKQLVENQDHQVSDLVICGDLTEKKSGHSARLVNRMATEFHKLSEHFSRIHIVPGNHDGEPGEQAFFEFLGMLSRINFYTKACYRTGGGFAPSMLFVPNGMLAQAFKLRPDIGKLDLAFLHEGFKGVQLSNGTKLKHGQEVPAKLGDLAHKIYSGDIHTPQRFRGIRYVGTPYPIDFDEDHQCRMVMITDECKEVIIPVEIIHKHTINVRTMDQLERTLRLISAGDQVKVVWALAEEDYGATAALYTSIYSRVHTAKAFLTGGVQFVLTAERGIAAIDCKDLTAVNAVHDVLTNYIRLKKIKPRLANVARKIAKKHR